MTEGTSQGLFLVVAIVIFGIFVALSYTLFANTLQPAMVGMFETALGVEETPVVVAPEEEVVYFEDKNLEYAVTAALYNLDTDLYMLAFEKAIEDLGPDFDGSAEQINPYMEVMQEEMIRDNPVTYAKLQELTILDASYSGITSLKGIENATNLEELNLTYNTDISDLTFIKGLTKMKKLEIFSANVTDLTPLKGLTNMEELVLSYNEITNLTPIENLTKLTSLSLQDSGVTDITPLAKLTNLKQLNIGDYTIGDYKNDIKDISILSNFKQLEDLDLADNINLKDITSIVDLPELQKVNLYGIPKSTLEGFEELKARTEVKIIGLD